MVSLALFGTVEDWILWVFLRKDTLEMAFELSLVR